MSIFSRFVRGTFQPLARIWAALGGAIGLAFLPIMQGWVSVPLGIGIGFLVALIVAYANVSGDLEKHRERWNEREKWNDIAHRLGQFGQEGKGLVPKPYTKIASWDQTRAWTEKVENYLEMNLGAGHRFLFSSGAGNEPMLPDSIRDEQSRDIWIHVQARLMTLKTLIWKAVDRADMIRP